jgi:hypothetical protein
MQNVDANATPLGFVQGSTRKSENWSKSGSYSWASHPYIFHMQIVVWWQSPSLETKPGQILALQTMRRV